MKIYLLLKETRFVHVVAHEDDENEGIKDPVLGSEMNESIEEDSNRMQEMPRATVMIKLILTMVWRNLIRNPNTYASVSGLVWSLIFFRYFFYLFNCFLMCLSTLMCANHTQKLKKSIVNSIYTIHQSWLLVSRWNITTPPIIKGSIEIISNAGLGMAMFSLGMYYFNLLFYFFN